MDKMREEFEAWASSEFGTNLQTEHHDAYLNVKEFSWKVWKASRAALCFELPKTPNFSASDEPDLAFEYGVDVMKDIIEAAGVTCK